MRYERYPTDVWSWRGTLLVVLTAWLAPLAVTAWLVPATRSWAGVTMVTQATVSASLLVAALIVYFHFRLTGTELLGWLSAGLALIATQSIAFAGVHADQPGAFVAGSGWVLLTDLILAVTAVALVPLADRTAVRVDPLAAGLLTGLALTGVHLLLISQAPRLDPNEVPVALVAVVLGGAGLGAAVLGSRTTALPAWVTCRLAAGIALATVNRIQTCLPSGTTTAAVLMTITGVAAAVLLVSTTVAALRWAIAEHGRRFVHLRERIAQMEAVERDNQARMHEVTNTIAGIASASTLIHSGPDLPVVHRHRLEEMVERETARLARILRHGGARSRPAPWPTGPNDGVGPSETPLPGRPDRRANPDVVDLDQILRPLVVAQQAIGRTVRWTPGRVRVLGDPDDLSEALNILLDNARKHAPGTTTTVLVTREGRDVHVAVSDDGPGVPAEVGDQIFEWGQRGPASTGQGLGLHLARQRLRDSGCSLHLERATTGATFVVRLSAASRMTAPAVPPASQPPLGPVFDLEAR